VDRIHKQREIVHHRSPADDPPAKLAESWVILLACGLALVVITWLDYITDPHLIFLPLFLLPCMMITLVYQLRWGLATAFLAIATTSWVEYATNRLNHYTIAEVFVWNFAMRFAVSVLVLILLNRIRKENILFLHQKPNGH
jgi:cellulose synthase/poly-beta-1,6-N-acetylglucosamine synthase-like glycosyltransferase